MRIQESGYLPSMQSTKNLAKYDASAITEHLFIAPMPRTRSMPTMRGLGVDLVISMIWRRPPRELTRPPFRLIRLPSFDFPLLPIRQALLRRGAAAASLVLDAGGRVLVYCRAGRHRSVAMAACILIAQGMTADEAMATIMAHRAIADPHAAHIERQIRAFEKDWLARQRPATA